MQSTRNDWCNEMTDAKHSAKRVACSWLLCFGFEFFSPRPRMSWIANEWTGEERFTGGEPSDWEIAKQSCSSRLNHPLPLHNGDHEILGSALNPIFRESIHIEMEQIHLKTRLRLMWKCICYLCPNEIVGHCYIAGKWSQPSRIHSAKEIASNLSPWLKRPFVACHAATTWRRHWNESRWQTREENSLWQMFESG